MLYVIHAANHPELEYRGGQGPIIHLDGESCARRSMGDAQLRRWAFTPPMLEHIIPHFTRMSARWIS